MESSKKKTEHLSLCRLTSVEIELALSSAEQATWKPPHCLPLTGFSFSQHSKEDFHFTSDT